MWPRQGHKSVPQGEGVAWQLCHRVRTNICRDEPLSTCKCLDCSPRIRNSSYFIFESLVPYPASGRWSLSFFFFFFFWPHLWHGEVPRPGTEPLSQQWQCQILSLLSLQGTPTQCHLDPVTWVLTLVQGHGECVWEPEEKNEWVLAF